MLRGISASDDPVSVDTGLVLLDVNELNALVFRMCFAMALLPFGGRFPFTSCGEDLFCKKSSRRVCSSSFDFFAFSTNDSGELSPISSSENSKRKSYQFGFKSFHSTISGADKHAVRCITR